MSIHFKSGIALVRGWGWLLVALPLSSSLVRLQEAAPLEPSADTPRPASAITFSHDIARIIYARCAPCHHSGQSAPFDLMTFRDVQKRAKQILEVTESHYMPPWLPEPGFGEFANVRRLTAEEFGLIRQWIAEGALEGDPKETPPAPQWPDGWIQGKPDLVVTMEHPYTLGPEGADLYRNFVIRVPLDRDRYVKAVEFSPGNARIVHHAFIRVDENGDSRRLDGRDGEPGFGGLNTQAQMPGGQFLSWQPGKIPNPVPEELAWRLRKGSDLLLQLHLNRTGKPEIIQSSIALYFTDLEPTNACFKLKLTSFALDFPPASSNNVVRDSFTLPVETDLLAILPHAHYLAKEMQGYATLPDGTKKSLLWIKQWDFRWQGDYRYAEPIHLPNGTTLHLQYTYDNSTNNLSNPNHPPKRVVYGGQSTDEMCELWFQLLPRRREDVALLDRAVFNHMRPLIVTEYRHRISANPDDAEALTKLGMILCGENQTKEGWPMIERAVKLDPDFVEAHFNKGVLLRMANRLDEAKHELETAVHLDPRHAKAYGQLGFTFASMNQVAEAERCFQKSLDLNPNDSAIKQSLEELRRQSHSP